MSLFVSELVLQIGLVLFVSMLLGAVFARFRQSPIIGYVLGGILLGPAVLGFVPHGELIALFSELGVIILLFYIGLELDTERLREGGFAALSLGPLKIVACFALGFLGALALGLALMEAVLAGLVVAVSSTAIIAAYLVSRGHIHKMEGHLSLTMLLIEDFAAIIVLALLGAAPGSLGLSTVLLNTLFFVVVAIFVIGAFGRYFVGLIERFDYSQHITLYAMGIGLFVAFLAQFFGLSPAIGAFFGGFLMSGLVHAEKVRRELGTFRDFFLLFFFVSIGLSFSLSTDPGFWVFTLALTLVLFAAALLGRYLAYGLGGSIAGLDAGFGVYLSGLMLPMGEFSLLIAGAGVSLGLPHAPHILAATLLLVLFSAALSPRAMRSSQGIERGVKRVLPGFFKQGVYALRAQFAWFTTLASTKERAQDALFASLQRIGLYVFAVFGVVYLSVYALSLFSAPLFAGLPNEAVFAVLGAVFVFPPVAAMQRELKSLLSAALESNPSLFGGFTRFQESLVRGAVADAFLGVLLLALALAALIAAYFLPPFYILLPVIFASLGAVLLIRGVWVAHRKYARLHRDVRIINALHKMSSAKLERDD